ncbi:histidine ammonia-lyase [uncultured Thermanaerothrix sp.]|uniref:histidine ammonia-lyase n=1 Tax=uncultured Thermanaerothrix sp. TaxID=1195149 RepID=UPI0026217877|nr:histidine ammonia-lyase [uncultured Thermanaerothrix sp.]
MLEIDGHHLSIADIVAVARYKEPVSLSAEGVESIRRSRQWLERILQDDRPVYGINTGFGIFAERRIKAEARDRLSRNLILSHAVATGSPLPEDVVRAAMLIRANTLTRGHSGVRVEVVQTLLDMLNRGVTPIVPEQGSLGSSGDLALLSHLALVFSTDAEDRREDSGWASYKGQIMQGKDAMQAAGIERLILGAKEGLAINNGATFSAAIAALAIHDTEILLRTAEVALAMTLEAIMGCIEAFDARIQAARGHPGQARVAEHVRGLTQGSTLLGRAQRVQDAYSLRCAPQVQGAAWDTLAFVIQVIEREINAATDNPLLFEDGVVLSGGNFHGEPIGMAMDFLGIAVAEVAAIAERRIFRLTDGKLNGGLPPMLVDYPDAAGLNSGLMMPQYTAASLVLENQTLAHPDSVHSLPTSGEQEDHNANAMTAARHARQIVLNTAHVIAIELYTAGRALDLRLRQYPEARLGRGTYEAYRLLRERVPYQAGDAWWGPEIETVRAMVQEGRFAQI